MDSEESEEDYQENSSDYDEEDKVKRKKRIVKKDSKKPKASEADKQKNTKATKTKEPRVKKKESKEPKEDKPENKEVAELKSNAVAIVRQKPSLQIEPLKPMKNEDYERLMNCESAPSFSLNYETHLAKIVSIYDGDTVTALFYINGDLKQFKVRINGIDTAEIKDPDPQISDLGKKTMESIYPLKGRVIKAQMGKFDKYGRLLSKIYAQTATGDIQLSSWMISQGIAKPYLGKHKNVFTKDDVARLKDKIDSIRLPEVQHYRNPVMPQS